MEVVYATLAGMMCGIVFSLLKLPVPAPPMLSGVMGVVGVWLGHVVVQYFQGGS